MYIFKVTYMNMDTEELRTSNIEIQAEHLNDAYKTVFEKALALAHRNEYLQCTECVL